jgi:hypothetical protein
VLVAYPIIECKRQSNTTSYADEEALEPATKLTKKVLHTLFDGRLNARYDSISYADQNANKKILDSVLSSFLTKKQKNYKISQPLKFPSNASLILIPYLIWTRSTDDYNYGKCGIDGKIYSTNSVCTWTRAQAHLILVERENREIIYFKYNQWDRGNMWMPFEPRIYRSFYQCSKKLLKKLGKNSMPPPNAFRSMHYMIEKDKRILKNKKTDTDTSLK